MKNELGEHPSLNEANQESEQHAQLNARLDALYSKIDEMCRSVESREKDPGGILHITNNILPVAAYALKKGRLDDAAEGISMVETYVQLLEKFPKILEELTENDGLRTTYSELGKAAYEEGVRTGKSNAVIFIRMLKALLEPESP